MSKINEDFIDQEGRITDGCALSVETYYVRLLDAFIAQGADYVRLVMDDGACNIESRISFSSIKELYKAITDIQAGELGKGSKE